MGKNIKINDITRTYLKSLMKPMPKDLEILRELRKGTDPKKVIPEEFLPYQTTEGR